MHDPHFKCFYCNNSQQDLFKITAPTPGCFLLHVQTEGCLASLRKVSTSCCFCPLGFAKWKVFARVFSSGAESNSSTSGSSCNSDSEMVKNQLPTVLKSLFSSLIYFKKKEAWLDGKERKFS